MKTELELANALGKDLQELFQIHKEMAAETEGGILKITEQNMEEILQESIERLEKKKLSTSDKTSAEDAMSDNDEEEEEDLSEQWERHYNEALNELLSNESLSNEKRTEGIKFLSYVNDSMKNFILEEFESISETFEECDLIEVLLTGLDNLFGKAYYEPQSHMLGNQYGIIKKFDEYSQIEFDPFVLEDQMLAEYTVKKDGWYLTLHMYEDNPTELRFTAFEY